MKLTHTVRDRAEIVAVTALSAVGETARQVAGWAAQLANEVLLTHQARLVERVMADASDPTALGINADGTVVWMDLNRKTVTGLAEREAMDARLLAAEQADAELNAWGRDLSHVERHRGWDLPGKSNIARTNAAYVSLVIDDRQAD